MRAPNSKHCILWIDIDFWRILPKTIKKNSIDSKQKAFKCQKKLLELFFAKQNWLTRDERLAELSKFYLVLMQKEKNDCDEKVP